MVQNNAVRGVEESDYSPMAYDLVLEWGGEIVHVPVTSVSRSRLSGFEGNVPMQFDIDCVYVWEGKLAGESRHADGTVIEMHETEPGSGEFRVAELTNPSSVDPAGRELWRRQGKERNELGRLVREGLSPAEALDYWMVEWEESTATAWASERGTSHQAVSENVRKAREKIRDRRR